MSRIFIKWFLALSVVLATGSVGFGQDFQKGVAAFASGDFTTAVREWRPLAEQGNAAAQSNLGWMYNEGRGVTQDYAEAVNWYHKAAEQGDAKAQWILGTMYDDGRGVTQDYAEAVNWYRKAAEQGDAKAQFSLGVMYAKGDGVIQDNVYAHKWLNIAASSGLEEARKNRDIVAKQMTAADISKAQELARECVQKQFKGVEAEGLGGTTNFVGRH